MADQGWEQVAAEAAKAVDLLRANQCNACGDAADLIDKMAEQLTSTAAEVARLRAREQEYGQHLLDCPAHPLGDSDRCLCGFDTDSNAAGEAEGA